MNPFLDKDAPTPSELFECAVFEDGLAAAIEMALLPGSGMDTLSLQLAAMRVLAVNVAERLGLDNPFDADVTDPFFTPDEMLCAATDFDPANTSPTAVASCAGAELAGACETAADLTATSFADGLPVDAQPTGAQPMTPSCEDAPPPTTASEQSDLALATDAVSDVMGRLEHVIREAHALMNQTGALRALGIARFARFDDPAGSPGGVGTVPVEHPVGHRAEFAADSLAPDLELGVHEGSSVVDESAWMTSKTPRLLEECVAGRANLATVAAIARELQDAAPETCEVVEDALRRKGIHHHPRTRARRSARTLVTKHEEAAARRTQRTELGRQINVWLDPHPTAGLATLTATMWSQDACVLKDTIDALAERRHREARRDGVADSSFLGEHRADALLELALAGVSLTAHVDLIVPVAPEGGPGFVGPVTSHDGPGGIDPVAPETGPSGIGMVPLNAGPDALGPVTPDGDPDAVSPDPSRDAADSEGRPDSTNSPPTRPAPAERLDIAQWTTSARPYAGLVAFHSKLGPLAAQRMVELLHRYGATVLATVREFDVTTGRLLDQAVSRAYRPPPSMRERVARRDQRCRFPNCDRPARFADQDHVIPWPDGPSADANLQCLCRRHHRAKQAGWKVTMTADAVCRWTSPTGRTHLTYPGFLEAFRDAVG